MDSEGLMRVKDLLDWQYGGQSAGKIGGCQREEY